MSGLDIAFFGSSLVSAYWNGAATYYRGIVRALAERGHRVTFYEPDAYGRQQHRDIADPEWARVVVYDPDRWADALERARGADVVVKASGVGVRDAELEAGVLELDVPRTIFWDVDAPATLARMEADEDDALRALLPRYDLVLTYGGGDPVVLRYHALGARDCVPVYNALDPDTHHPVPRKVDFTCDLGFLGNRLPDREARVGEFLLNPARHLPDRTFVLGGAGWETKSLPPNVRAPGHVRTADHNAFFCSSMATLNINRESMARYGFSPPTRIFEAAGSGACIISDAWEGIDLFLEPGREILLADNGEAVADALDRLTLAAAQQIGQAARARILAQHTYAHRARQFMEILDLTTRREAAE
jgi:spore maturation protein CgeB